MANSAGEKKTITIDIEKFVHTRNALNTAFLGLSNSIDKAVKAYIEHTQAVLEDDGTLDLSILLQPFETLQAAAAVKQVIAQNDVLAADAAADTLDPANAVKKKEKRAYKPRDPNAPKRPLTAYFRYIQTMRPQIKQEIANGERPPSDVSITCSEMWHALTPEERDAFKKDYQKEVVGYEKACAAYKAAGGTDEGLHGSYETELDINMPDEASGDESEEAEPVAKEEPAPKKAAAKAKPAAAPASAVKASATPAKPKAAPKKKAAAATGAGAAAAPAATAPTPKTDGKQKFSSLNPPNTSIDEPEKTEVEKTPTARKRKATVKAAADEATEAETPKPKRARKTKAQKEAEEAELAKTLEAAATSTPAAPAAAAAAPASESKAKKPRKRKSEVAAE